MDQRGLYRAGETPEEILAAIRGGADWNVSRRAGAHERIATRFTPERIRAAIRDRLPFLDAPDGDVVLQLVKAFATPELLAELADQLALQPDLAAERAWEALNIIASTPRGLHAHPELAQRLAELEELLEAEDEPLRKLAALLEDAETLPTALEGLGRIEPDVRAEIVAGLGELPAHPGLLEFLRLVALGPEPAPRAAAIEAIVALGEAARATRDWLAREHPDPAARQRLATPGGGAPPHPGVLSAIAEPRLIGSVVTAVDETGTAMIALVATDGRRNVAATFICDVLRGIVAVEGMHLDPGADLAPILPELAGDAWVEQDHDLALRLLGGCWLASGPDLPAGIRHWLERTAGPDLRPAPVRIAGLDPRPARADSAGLAALTEDVLDALPSWLDRSELVCDLAEELLLRPDGDSAAAADAIRYLCAQRLLPRLERDRRMLRWMAAFWQAGGQRGLAAAAAELAEALGDETLLTPAHPVLSTLAARSLEAARERLRAERGTGPS